MTQTLRSGQYFTAEDLAIKLNVGRATIYRWLKAGKLKPTYIGDLLRFFEKDILLLDKHDTK